MITWCLAQIVRHQAASAKSCQFVFGYNVLWRPKAAGLVARTLPFIHLLTQLSEGERKAESLQQELLIFDATPLCCCLQLTPHLDLPLFVSEDICAPGFCCHPSAASTACCQP
jgi:hypothetical protein